jgi:serine/threonine-protein kinase
MVRAHRLTATAIPGEIRLDAAAAAWMQDNEVGPGEAVEFAPGHPEATYVIDPHRGETPPVEPERDRSDLEAALMATSVARPVESLALGETMVSRGLTPPTRAAPPTLEPGRLFDGRYRIDAKIGRGGSATVYRAEHIALHEPRAIKLLHPESLARPGAVDQLRREAEATSRIHHPNVVQLHDFGRSVEGHYYLSLELVTGESLAVALHRDGRLPVSRALGYARGILEALQAAHRLHLIHRDLKPGNVLVDRRDQARVTDFGMAQSLHDRRSGHDQIAGTPAYMSPEQCEGKPLDGRTDLYSFGVTLYHMLSGALPYRDTSGDPFKLALSADRVPLEQRVPDIAPALVAVVARCLAVDPAARPPSALAVLRELPAL